MAAAKGSDPCQVRRHVMSVSEARFGWLTVNRRCTRLGVNTAGFPTDHRRVR